MADRLPPAGWPEEVHWTRQCYLFFYVGVNILGIDSVMQPAENRTRIWQRVANDLPLDKLDALTTLAPLSAVPELAKSILDGQVRGSNGC